MAGTFSQIYIQYIFAVQGREHLISSQWKDELYRYITGIVTNKGQKLIAINGISDHIHIFVGLRPLMAPSDLLRDIKNNSTNFINDKKFVPGKFTWQEGYGVFSYSHSHLNSVFQYIMNQERHHKRKTFREEYLEFLRKFEIDHDERYLFEWIE